MRHVPEPEEDADEMIEPEGELEDGEAPVVKPKKAPKNVNVSLTTEERMISNQVDDVSEELNIEAK